MKNRMKSLLGTLAFLVLAGVAVSSLITVITPVEMTHTAIGESFARMSLYMTEHHRFPASLDELPKRDGYANRTTDGWCRPLIYRVEEDNLVTLLSLGKDGQPDGTGENADIQTTYRTKNPDGSWCVDDEMWIVTAEIRETPTTKSTLSSEAAPSAAPSER